MGAWDLGPGWAGRATEHLPARDATRLRHIAEACDRVLRYAAGGRSSLNDERTYDAVLRCLTIIGEALGALSDDTYGRLGSVPPHLPKAQRNLIVHEYWPIDPDVVWATVERHIPLLGDDVGTNFAEGGGTAAPPDLPVHLDGNGPRSGIDLRGTRAMEESFAPDARDSAHGRSDTA